jgi:hypothetical protein
MTRFFRTVGFLFLVVSSTTLAQSPRGPEEIDIVKSPRLYGTHFGRYGKTPSKVIRFNQQFVRFLFPNGEKELDQHGLYSYFSLAGDFEIEVEFELTALKAPSEGYGPSIGIALETVTALGDVTWSRGLTGDKPPLSGWILTRSIPQENERKYESQFFPSNAKQGKLGFKRERDDLIFLASEKKNEPLQEIGRLPFTREKITKMRFVADRGGDANFFDNQIGKLKVRAAEITGGLPQEELGDGPNWFRIACLVTLIGGAWFFIKRWRARSFMDN